MSHGLHYCIDGASASFGLGLPPYKDTHVTGVCSGPRTSPFHTNFKYPNRLTLHVPSAPLAHLYSAMSQTSAVRAFSTSSRLWSEVEKEEDHAVDDGQGESADVVANEAEEPDFLETLNIDGTLGLPIAKAIRHVRKTHKLTGPEYNDYWRLMVEAQLVEGEEKDGANANAARVLTDIETNNGNLSMGKRSSTTKHDRLMDHVQKYADIVSKTQETERITSSRRDALTGLLGEIETPPFTTRLIEDLERKIVDLQSQIGMEKAKYVSVTPTASAKFAFKPNDIESQAEFSRLKRNSREMLIKEHFPDIQIEGVALGFMERVARHFYQAEFQFSKQGPNNSAKDIQSWEELRTEVIQDLRDGLQQTKGVKRCIAQARRRILALMNAAKTSPSPVTDSSEENPAEGLISQSSESPEMPAAVKKELSELEKTIEGYRQQLRVIRTAVSQQAQRVNDVRQQKRDLHARRKAVLRQLEEQELSMQQARFILRPKVLDKVPKLQLRTNLDDILDEALVQTGMPVEAVGADEGSVREGSLHRLGFRDAGEMDNVIETRHASIPGATSSAAPEPGATITSSATPTKPTIQSAIDSISKLSGSSLTTPQSLSFQKNTATILSPPERKPGSALRLQIPTSNTISIDETLTINFSAPVPTLQTQIYEMQKRLRTSYPRIDNLPYEIWKSENKRTLQTWLKILVGRWQTRFDGVREKADAEAVDEQVQAVLDHMVRDHDLSNEAAERMAMHWHEVVTQRGQMDGDAEGALDWEEFDAGGFGFMAVEEDNGEFGAKAVLQEGEGREAVENGGASMPSGKRGDVSSFERITKRLYSTSTRPPREGLTRSSISTSTSESQSPTSTSKPQSQSHQNTTPNPHLPHLTPTGTVHMVSVSSKIPTHRTAIAAGTVVFSNPAPLCLIRSASLKKGDVLAVSRVAGIMAAKKCPDIVPLCHPIALSHVSVEVEMLSATEAGECDEHALPFGGVQIQAQVECQGPTGVEMEALTAVMGAALSVLDMCKAVDKKQRIEGVRVLRKEGGRSGDWVAE